MKNAGETQLAKQIFFFSPVVSIDTVVLHTLLGGDCVSFLSIQCVILSLICMGTLGWYLTLHRYQVF